MLVLLLACRATSDDVKLATDSATAGERDEDGDTYTPDDGDCDDHDSSVNPGAVEVCDSLDNDCDGQVDDGVRVTFYADADEDGYGDPDAAEDACTQPAGTVTTGTDCDDTDPDAFPGNPEVCDKADNNCDGAVDEGVANSYFPDADGDAYGDPGGGVEACEAPGGYIADASDCDDTQADTNPAAAEICDEHDNDCDGEVDDGVERIFWADVDGDGYGDDSLSQSSCFLPTGYAEDPGDCDDADAAVFPDATEWCDGNDDDCDGAIDEDAADALPWYADADADTYGDAGSVAFACTLPAGHVADDTDCDDSADGVHPGAAETCDGVDDDCDGDTDEDDALDAVTWYLDYDDDGFGGTRITTVACAAPAHHVADGTDCDDTLDTVFPGAPEDCNGEDDDCDGSVDDGAAAADWYADTDGDGFGDATDVASACDAPAGYVADDTDCDDTLGTVFPGATETCDGADEDCDGDVDEGLGAMGTWYEDADGDGFGEAAVSGCTQPAGTVDNDWDCDDADASVYPGGSSLCPWTSCADLLGDGIASTDGSYWIDFAGTATETSCDMTTDGGGWTLIFSDDFEGGVDPGWSMTSTYVCGGWSTLLGGYGILSGGEVGIAASTYAIAHAEARVTLDYAKLDSWDGELAYVEFDGTTVWSENLYYYDGAEVCGWNRGYEGSYDELHAVTATGSHSAGTLTFTAGSTLDQDAGDESFGIDDVALWIR